MCVASILNQRSKKLTNYTIGMVPKFGFFFLHEHKLQGGKIGNVQNVMWSEVDCWIPKTSPRYSCKQSGACYGDMCCSQTRNSSSSFRIWIWHLGTRFSGLPSNELSLLNIYAINTHVERCFLWMHMMTILQKSWWWIILRDFNMVEDVGDKVFSKLSFHCKQKTFYVRLVQNCIQYWRITKVSG